MVLDFASRPRFCQFPEDTAVGTVIATFEATDADFTEDEPVRYRILDTGVPFSVLSNGQVSRWAANRSEKHDRLAVARRRVIITCND